MARRRLHSYEQAGLWLCLSASVVIWLFDSSMWPGAAVFSMMMVIAYTIGVPE